jgi:peroxiredoxin family protein
MTIFNSNSEAKKKAELLANTCQVFFTNEGLEILFTSENNNQKEVLSNLKTVFSDVKIKGRKIPRIVINRVNQITNAGRITEVTY